MDKTKIAQELSSAHLETIYDKYLVIGFKSEQGLSTFTNCTAEQLGLLLSLFHQQILEAQNELSNPPDASLN